MSARWIRLGAYTSAALVVAYMLLQIWRLDADYPNVTLDKLPAAANNLFSCLEWPRTIYRSTHDTPYCCSYGDYHEATSWVNVRLPGWRPKTERWSYCEDGPTMCCCTDHPGDELAGQGLYCGRIAQTLEQRILNVWPNFDKRP